MAEQPKQVVYRISEKDNVATALTEVTPGEVTLRGGAGGSTVLAKEAIASGHKIALRDIKAGEPVVKYGVQIGECTKDIPAGHWVHLHNIRSLYDGYSSGMNVVTGLPNDAKYE